MKLKRQTAFRLGAGLFALLAVLHGAPITGQSKPPLTLVGLAEIPRLLDPQLSPDGRFVAYMLMRADWKANRQVGHIWRQAVSGGAPIQLTKGDAGEANARWSPDGQSLLYLAPGSPAGMQLFLLPAEGGEPRQLTRHATSVSQPAWSPDGTAIYFLASDPRTAEEIERDRLRDDVFVFEENFKQRHLWRVVVSTSIEQKITNGDFSILSYRLARDGRHITAHRAPTPLAGDGYRGEIWLTDADGGNGRPLTSNTVEEIESELSPDNAQVMFLAEAAEGKDGRLDPYYTSTLFLAPARGGAPRMLLPDFPYSIEHAAWAADSRAIVATVNMGVHSEIFRIDVAARRATPLTNGRHSVQFWSAVSAAGRMVFQLDEPTRLGDAWTLPFSGGAPVRATGIYDALERSYSLPRQEKVVWKSGDGTAVEGLLFYPLGYEADTRYPLVVQLHGGPQESDKFGYGPGVIVNYVPVLTAKGYLVLRPNYRGSTGYGNAFMRDVIGGYFRNMPADVLSGVDFLIGQGVADPNRLAVMGWSAGAHLTNKLITMTGRFKAASSTAGAANWTSLFAQTDTRANRSLWFGGTPWQPNAPIDAFWNNSPLKDASNVTTPTLFVVGQEDPRVPLAQSIEMYRALKSNDVPVRLIVAPREGHQWGELRHQIFKANAELEWFERYVMGRSYAWERPPADGS
jgi:dipeptidyl aminopeptidase/acylaminoacyl peptidase